MWCDNCCLFFPLRAGGIAWATFVALYSAAGATFLFMRGEYLFFIYPESELYSGIGMAVAGVALVSAIALSSRSYIWSRAMKFVWPFLIVVSAIRAVLMIVQLQRNKDKIAWECSHGGQMWDPTIVHGRPPSGPLPDAFCTTGFTSLWSAFVVALLIDIVCEIYLFFLVWRFSKRLEHYSGMKGPFYGGYYNA